MKVSQPAGSTPTDACAQKAEEKEEAGNAKPQAILIKGSQRAGRLVRVIPAVRDPQDPRDTPWLRRAVPPGGGGGENIF